MTSDISYDLVLVIDENEAIGETAKILKDIRGTMNIQLITSIWRGLLIEAKVYLKNDLSSKAYSVIKSYVHEKDKVIRMVVIGFIMQKWIEKQKFLDLNN